MRPVPRLLRSPVTASVLASTLVFLSIMGLRGTGSLESLELAAYDWYIGLRPAAAAPDSRIVLIAITESDIHHQGRWPLTDATLVQVLERLMQSRPRAIGLDLYRDVSVPPGGEELDAMLTSNRQIIAAMKFGDDVEIGIPPPPVLKQTDQVGFNDVLVDPGGIVRRGLLFQDDGQHSGSSFALQLALLYLQAEGIAPQLDMSNPQHTRLGRAIIRPFEPNDGGYVGADARGYQFLLDYGGARGAFPSYSLTTLLSGGIDPGAIQDKIVLIGVVAASVKDFFYTPYSRGLQADQQMPGIALHAHIISQLLRAALDGNASVATLSDWYEGFWILLWSVMGGAIGLWMRSSWRFSLWTASGLLLLSLATYLAFVRGWWIPFVPPAMAWLCSAAVVTAYMSNQEKGQRALLMQLFSKYVSPEVAEAIWQQRDQLLDGGRLRSQKLIATVLISDLQGSTSLSEKMDPQVLMDWLNTYMETMARVVMAHGGAIDDYRGDGFKADFGIPLARTTAAEISRDAVNAVKCALAMARELKRLNMLWQEEHLPTASVRIGIFTGPVVAGSLGSAQRLQYTTVGDTANIAARLESFDKDFLDPYSTNNPCRILLGEATLGYLGQQFKTLQVGEVSLRGKDQKITIYRVIGPEDSNGCSSSQEERE
jgi:adenylate cyclase